MRISILISLSVLLSFFLTGCGYHEGVIQSDSKSYLWFTGNINNAVVYIDDNAPFSLKTVTYIDEATGEKKENAELTHYQISPGKHDIIVKRDSIVVVNRKILLGSGITKEISIP